MVDAKDVQLVCRLPSDLKRRIEEAAASLGQSVDEFVIDAAAFRTRKVIEIVGLGDVTHLSDRDRDRVIALLDDVDALPNAALVKAAERYGEHLG